MDYPNFFLVGGPRCGSTFVYRFLEEHPDIFFSARKETHFFSKDFHAECDDLHGDAAKNIKLFSVRTMEKYLGQYDERGATKIVGDASTSHLYSSVAAGAIAEFNPQAKILVSLRNPIDQMCSWHAYLVRHREEPIADFGAAMDANKRGLKRDDFSAALRHTNRINYRYITDYLTHLERFRQYFPNEQIHITVFDDFRRNPASEFRAIYNFLGVDADVADQLNYGQTNANQTLMFAGLFGKLVDKESFIRRMGDALLPKSVGRKLHQGLIKTFTTSAKRKGADQEAVQALKKELRPRVEALSAALGRDFIELWKFDDV
jgi:hypothetical protein